MPTVSVVRPDITKEEAATALQAQLGSQYAVAVKEGSSHEVLSVKKSTLSFASVRLVREAGVTKFRVHGGGLIIGRLMNELTIALKVAAAIKAAPGLGGAS
jgi:hypothetical protein